MTHVESTDLDPLMQGEPPEAEAPLSPQARLDASRAALQQWMIRTYHPERLAPDPDTPTHGSVRPDNANPDDPPWLSALVDSLSDVPIGAVAARYLRRWWRRHPLRATAELGNELGRELLAPAAAKHPWLVLGGAVVAGVLLSRLKPWRWLSRTDQRVHIGVAIGLGHGDVPVGACRTRVRPADWGRNRGDRAGVGTRLSPRWTSSAASYSASRPRPMVHPNGHFYSPSID